VVNNIIIRAETFSSQRGVFEEVWRAKWGEQMIFMQPDGEEYGERQGKKGCP